MHISLLSLRGGTSDSEFGLSFVEVFLTASFQFLYEQLDDFVLAERHFVAIRPFLLRHRFFMNSRYIFFGLPCMQWSFCNVVSGLCVVVLVLQT